MFGLKDKRAKHKNSYGEIKKQLFGNCVIKPDSIFDGTYGGPAIGLPDTRNGFAKDRQNLRRDVANLNKDIHKAGERFKKEYQK